MLYPREKFSTGHKCSHSLQFSVSNCCLSMNCQMLYTYMQFQSFQFHCSGEDDLQRVFYHICAWQPPLWADWNHFNRLLFPIPGGIIRNVSISLQGQPRIMIGTNLVWRSMLKVSFQDLLKADVSYQPFHVDQEKGNDKVTSNW